MDKHTHIEEEIRLLLRSIRSKRFYFILVQYNHKSAVQLVKDRIAAAYPDRPTLTITTEDSTYRQLMDSIYGLPEGIAYIEDFDNLLKKPELYRGFNMRRDKISTQPIALIGFMLKGKANITRAMENIADMWSMRSLIAEIDVPVPEQNFQFITPEFRKISTLGGANMEDKEVELERLKKRLERLPDNNTNLLNYLNTYKQILILCDDIGDYETGLEYSKQLLELAQNKGFEKSNPHILADIYERIMTFNRYLGNYKSAILYSEKLNKIINIEKTLPYTSTHYNNMALLYERHGDYERAKNFYQLALDNTLEENDINGFTATSSNLANLYGELGNYTGASELLEKVLDKDIKTYGENHPIVAGDKSNLGLAYRDIGNYGKAKKLFEDAVKIDLQYFGKKHPNTLTTLSNLATVYTDLQEYNKAKKCYEDILKTEIEIFGKEHPNVARTQANLAALHYDLGNFDKAKDLLESALQLNIEHFGEHHPTVAYQESSLANVYNNLKKHKKAKELIERALSTIIEKFGTHHPEVIRIQSDLGIILIELREYKEAINLLNLTLKLSIENLGENHINTAKIYDYLATAYIDMKKWDKALSLFEKEYDILLKILGKEHHKTVTISSNIKTLQQKLTPTQ